MICLLVLSDLKILKHKHFYRGWKECLGRHHKPNFNLTLCCVSASHECWKWKRKLFFHTPIFKQFIQSKQVGFRIRRIFFIVLGSSFQADWILLSEILIRNIRKRFFNSYLCCWNRKNYFRELIRLNRKCCHKPILQTTSIFTSDVTLNQKSRLLVEWSNEVDEQNFILGKMCENILILDIFYNFSTNEREFWRNKPPSFLSRFWYIKVWRSRAE